ncbi:outer membrane protein transport protein [Thalassobacter stenotrophicus]|uniref:Outer membrane protein transport protein (OMPP1/FadL/TodX) n=2 Tax=Thalassobacter stenotrophicus TaxID=266809 RepID=A0A0N7LT26_9RHOB|nr:hypothetical protein [Thalassobacter stenotrophicus]CUH59522.1 Outer membrane protein transport protein (OMPP1/FadL/TodX) [Thalassobacter stenotrophicus]SHI81645.1 Long-chain fatty acid transport protein [Thalassobacter stenotrophicus DSM 16310]
MKRIALAALLTTATATSALAGGIDRSGQFLGPLFQDGGETGSYFQFGIGSVEPSVGVSVPGLTGSDPLDTYVPWSAAIKLDVTDKLSFAIIGDQPFGANVNYSGLPFQSALLQGLNVEPGANIKTQAWTGVLRYELNETLSVHGGLRAQKASGQVNTRVGTGVVPPFRQLNASSDFALGALVGVAYERPEIALRIALTYNSEIDQKLTGTEITDIVSPATTAFTVTTPASLNLEFQTGVAADTLLFGSVRYVEWDGFNLTTPGAGQYVNFDKDTTTYSLGLGRRFNDTWSAAVTLGFEAKGDFAANSALAPTTGSQSIGLAATYTQGKTTVTTGVTYAKLGEREFDLGGTPVSFTDGEAIGVGVRLGINF